MSERRRQIFLTLVLGILPALLLGFGLWAYNFLFESMRVSLHEQRAMALRTLTVEVATASVKPYSLAFLRSGSTEIKVLSGEWPKYFDFDSVQGFRSSLGSTTEMGVEVSREASGPAILWIVPVEGGLRLAFQSRRAFYARLESFRVLVWMVGLLFAGGAFLLFVSVSGKLSEVFSEMETKNLELERANRHLEELGSLKSNFLALVSHELRTPLARLIGQINVLRQDAENLPEKVKKRFEDMAVEIEELGRMTKNALDLTRLQSEDLAARSELAQVSPIVKGCIEKLRSAASLRGLEISIDIPETPPVSHDPYLLERILDNLLVNAVKYASEKGRIDVRLVEKESFVQIQVDSSGVIIPETDRDKIFEKFYRLERESDVPGTGLGLYLVRQFILMMGGRAWVEPLTDGNRFIITLPLG